MKPGASRRVRGRLHVTFARENASSLSSLLAFQTGKTVELAPDGFVLESKRPYSTGTRLQGQIHLPDGAVVGFEGDVAQQRGERMNVRLSRPADARYLALLGRLAEITTVPDPTDVAAADDVTSGSVPVVMDDDPPVTDTQSIPIVLDELPAPRTDEINLAVEILKDEF